ncbi:MAG: winged helix DNA-binding domain-containing protein [Polyangiaceae bacterium]
MRKISVNERRARLGIKHHLALEHRATHSTDIAKRLVGFHGTDPATVYLSAIARSQGNAIEELDSSLYEDRSLIRTMGMRRTVWVVHHDTLPMVLASSTHKIAVAERKKLIQHIEQGGVAKDGARWLKKVESDTLAALRKRGSASANELSDDVPALRTTITMGEGKPYETQQRLTSRVLSLLSTESRIVRGRPSGSWLSSQYTWAPIEACFPEGLPQPSVEQAQEQVLRQWLGAFGPATQADMVWWTGWTARDVKRALQAIRAVEVELDEGPAFLLEEDEPPVKAPKPWVALLPALDPTAMGWMSRDWYLGSHRSALFDGTGNIGPTVWSNGEIIGGWAQHPATGDIVTELFSGAGAKVIGALTVATERLKEVLSDVRVKARFPTPTEKKLLAS